MGEAYLDEVQKLAERLASRIHRSVAIDDAEGNLIAVSRHYGDADDYRIRLILSRRASPQARDYFRSFTSSSLAESVSVPGRADLGFLPRICFPIRKDNRAFAFLWVIDTGAPLLEEVVLSYCHKFADLLDERRASEAAHDGGAISAHIASALAGDEAAWPRDDSPAGPDDRFLAAAAHLPQDSASRPAATAVLRELPRATMDLGLSLVCVATIESSVVGVFLASSVDLPGEDAFEAHLVEEANRLIGRRAAQVRFGLNRPCTEAELHRCGQEAIVASFICTHLFHDLGMLPWRAVSHLAGFVLSEQTLGGSPGLRALEAELRDPIGYSFDTWGAVLKHQTTEAAAEALRVHRTTLHYRMQQLQRRTGLDLRDAAIRFLGTALWLQIAAERSGLRGSPSANPPISG